MNRSLNRRPAHTPFALSAIACGALLFALSSTADAQALANQSIDVRLAALTRLVDQQQREIKQLEQNVINLEMAQRGRGEPGWTPPAVAADTADGVAQGVPDSPGGSNAGPSGSDAPRQSYAQVSPTGVPSGGNGTATGVPATPVAVPEGTAAPADQSVGQDQKATQPIRTQSEEAVVQREHAPLFDHKLTVDWGFSDTYYDRRNLSLSGFLALDAIFLGNINLIQTKSQQLMMDVDTRYGLTDRMSIDIDVPYLYRHSQFINGGAGGAANSVSDLSVNSSNIGDVNAGIYYQFLKETTNLPDIVGSLRFKSNSGSSPFGIKLLQGDPNNNNLIVPSRLPTGTGFWNITAGVSFLKTYDPIVLFGSLSYTYNVARSFADISSVQGQTEPARVKLGDIYQIGLGAAIAFSDKDSVSASFVTAFEPASKIAVPGSGYTSVPGSETNASTVNFGLNHVVNKHLTINGSVAIGLTPDAPNFVVGLRFPYTF